LKTFGVFPGLCLGDANALKNPGGLGAEPPKGGHPATKKEGKTKAQN